MVEIKYKSSSAVVIYKPHGVPAQPDPSGSPDAMTLTAALLRERGENDSLWLIHRLDRAVAGLMVFARTRESAAALSEIVKERQLTKEYLAVVRGALGSGAMRDFIYKDARTSKAYIVKGERRGVKEARLTYDTIATADGERERLSLVRITLETGRFHQIRAQLSHRGSPILGDRKYGSAEPLRGRIALVAFRLETELLGEKIRVEALPDTSDYPWSCFDAEAYERSIAK